MLNVKSYLGSIVLNISEIANPSDSYTRYQDQTMYNYYRNFLAMVATTIEDKCFKNQIENGTFKKWGLSQETIKLLSNLDAHLDTFYAKHEGSDDFILLRDNYWDILVPEAKQCVEALEKDIAKMED